MKRLVLAFSVAFVATAFFLSWQTPSSFHEEMPSKDVSFLVADENGGRVAAAQLMVRTTYWYPSIIGQPKSLTFKDSFVGDNSGRVAAKIKRHPQVTQMALTFTAVGYETYDTKIYEDSAWLESSTPQRRIALVVSPAPRPIRTVVWGKDGFSEEVKVYWRDKPLWISFSKRLVSEDEGDLRIDIERPPAGSEKKEDQAVGIRISYSAGLLQSVARNEVAFDLKKTGLATWGDVSELRSTRPNTRHHPCFWESFAFSSLDRKVRGALSVTCDPVRERDGEPAIVVLSVYGRVEYFE